MGTAGLEGAPQLLAPSCVLRVVVETAPVQVARAPTHLPFLHGRGCHSCRAPRASLQLRAAARRVRALQSRAASRGAANVGERGAELGSWVAESPSRRVHEPREETLPGKRRWPRIDPSGPPFSTRKGGTSGCAFRPGWARLLGGDEESINTALCPVVAAPGLEWRDRGWAEVTELRTGRRGMPPA